MKIENFKKIDKLPVICSFDVVFEDKGFGIREFRLMETNNSKWIAHPSRQYKDPEGKNKYFQFTSFQDKRKVQFDAQAMELLKPFLEVKDAFSSYAQDEIPF